MKQFVRINYFTQVWNEQTKSFELGKVTNKACETAISIDSIKSISPSPETFYMMSRLLSGSLHMEPITLYHLSTDIPYASKNGICFKSYYITCETFDRLTKVIEII